MSATPPEKHLIFAGSTLAQNVIRGAGMNALLKLSFLSGSILLAACGTVVSGGGGSGDPSLNSSTGDSPDDQVRPAVAYTRAQNDILWDEYWASQGSSGGGSTSGGSGGDNLDPNDLFLRISDLGVTCSSPTTELSCGGHYQLTLVLPPVLQKVGVYDLEDPQLVAYSSMSETGDLNSADPEDCPWGGGSLGQGSVEIISINDTDVRFKVSMGGSLWSNDPSGEYTALRCTSP